MHNQNDNINQSRLKIILHKLLVILSSFLAGSTFIVAVISLGLDITPIQNLLTSISIPKFKLLLQWLSDSAARREWQEAILTPLLLAVYTTIMSVGFFWLQRRASRTGTERFKLTSLWRNIKGSVSLREIRWSNFIQLSMKLPAKTRDYWNKLERNSKITVINSIIGVFSICLSIVSVSIESTKPGHPKKPALVQSSISSDPITADQKSFDVNIDVLKDDSNPEPPLVVRLKELHDQADKLFSHSDPKQALWTRPTDNCAAQKYLEILKLDPADQLAIERLGRISKKLYDVFMSDIMQIQKAKSQRKNSQSIKARIDTLQKEAELQLNLMKRFFPEDPRVMVMVDKLFPRHPREYWWRDGLISLERSDLDLAMDCLEQSYRKISRDYKYYYYLFWIDMIDVWPDEPDKKTTKYEERFKKGLNNIASIDSTQLLTKNIWREVMDYLGSRREIEMAKSFCANAPETIRRLDNIDSLCSEYYYLFGLKQKTERKLSNSVESFRAAISANHRNYNAVLELSEILWYLYQNSRHERVRAEGRGLIRGLDDELLDANQKERKKEINIMWNQPTP